MRGPSFCPGCGGIWPKREKTNLQTCPKAYEKLSFRYDASQIWVFKTPFYAFCACVTKSLPGATVGYLNKINAKIEFYDLVNR